LTSSNQHWRLSEAGYRAFGKPIDCQANWKLIEQKETITSQSAKLASATPYRLKVACDACSVLEN
jgi:hypothetical protein